MRKYKDLYTELSYKQAQKIKRKTLTFFGSHSQKLTTCNVQPRLH